MDLYDDPSIGGTNLLPAGSNYHDTFRNARTVRWDEPGLKVTRFRLLSDRGFPLWDVSYCHGYIGEEPVVVDLPFSQLAKHSFKYKDKHGAIKQGGWKAHVIAWGKKEGVNVYNLGILNAASTLN
jgi:hypothetical protein